MESETTNIKTAMISPAALNSECNWDAALFLFSRLWLLWSAHFRLRLSDVAKVLEGDRNLALLAEAETVSFYRAGSMVPFELIPSTEQWLAVNQSRQLPLQVGDIVLKRVAPVAAAVVPLGLPLLPVGDTFFIIRGLAEVEAWWVVFWLNHPPCVEYLISKSGRGVLSRVSLGVLRDWKMPVAPEGFARQAYRLADLLQKRTFLASRMAAVQAEVEAEVGEQMTASDYEDEHSFAAGSWSHFFPASVVDASWLPLHVATEFRSYMLRRDHEWQPLTSFLLPDSASRQRFSWLDEPVQVLRLSDVGNVPLIPASLDPLVPAQPSRIFCDPIHAEDVLLSTLASSPRVVFAPVRPQASVYPVDHWERLRFRSHTAAFALILQTGAITGQLRNLASGSIQQFVRSEDIQRLFLPVFAEETLAQWDRSFRSLCKSWLQTDAEWQAALQDGWQVVLRAFNSATSETPAHQP